MAFEYIGDLLEEAVRDVNPLETRGRVEQVVGTIIRAVVPGVKVGELCLLRNPWENWSLKAEVVGFVRNVALLSPLGNMQGISPATEVIPTGEILSVPVGYELLGRVVDGLGQAMDGGPAIRTRTHYPLVAEAPNPMTRKVISKPISLGLRVIDGVLTCGEGQRMGIFAAAGGGKSTLLSSILKGCTADVCVLALIGERGREVREFIERDIGPEGRKKAVLVVSTSDRSSMERLKAAYTATAIAEYFRDQGKSVLLMMDSVTRFGRAQREIGLAAGEPPTRRGFPPSVFSELPKLMERAGNSDKGSITALYTVLVEGDDMTEPIADETRSILDGHIVLSRKLAAANHYPAIDVQASVSRVMNAVVDKEHKAAAQALRKSGGCGVPTIKPWNIDTVKAKMEQAKASGCFAVAMDVDAAGLPFLKNMTPPAGSKSVEELAEIVQLAERPFIVKGVMTVKGALKAKQAGAAAIVVSNHGGRVLDQCPATAEVLPEIAAALKGTGVKVLVDGGIRTGVDVFKALALGADGVLICRPFVTAVYGGGAEGVKCYIDKLAGELADTMQMCGAHSLAEITPDMVRV